MTSHPATSRRGRPGVRAPGRSRAAGVSACLLISAVLAPTAAAQRILQPEDRLLITAFGDLTAVTAGPRRVFAAAPTGVIVYDNVARQWLPPLTLASGYPVDEQPTALAYDVFGDALWLGTATGALYTSPLTLRRWERVGAPSAGSILDLVAAPGEGAVYVRTRGGWQRLRSGSLFADPVSDAALPQSVRARAGGGEPGDPYFQAARGSMGTDPRGRHWQLTDVTPGDRPGLYWVATGGGGLLSFDSRTSEREWLTYGTVSPGVSTIAEDGGLLWFGGDGRGRRQGVARADAALQTWSQWDADYDHAPRGFVAEIVATTGATWFAAADGLFRLDAGAGGRFRRFTAAQGLPADGATALAASTAGLWVGTTAGLAVVGTADVAARPAGMAGLHIERLVLSRDTLWIATRRGLWIVPRAAARLEALLASPGDAIQPGDLPQQAPGVADQPALRGQVIDIRPTADGAWALLPDALYRYRSGHWEGPLREPAARGIGPFNRLLAAQDRLWLVGNRGLGILDPAADTWTYYTVPEDILAPVFDALPAGPFVWLATPAGAVRLRWRR